MNWSPHQACIVITRAAAAGSRLDGNYISRKNDTFVLPTKFNILINITNLFSLHCVEREKDRNKGKLIHTIIIAIAYYNFCFSFFPTLSVVVLQAYFFVHVNVRIKRKSRKSCKWQLLRQYRINEILTSLFLYSCSIWQNGSTLCLSFTSGLCVKKRCVTCTYVFNMVYFSDEDDDTRSKS